MIEAHKLMSYYCVGCGICTGICPSNAISIAVKQNVVTVSFDYSKCINCLLCSRVCPALKNVYTSTKAMVRTFVKSITGIERIFFGWSKDGELRYEAASGGIVTSLLKYVIEHKIADHVIITIQQGFTANPYITNDFATVFKSRGSIYFKTFTAKAIREILKLLRNGRRVVFVGLPCMIKAIKYVIPRQLHDRILFICLMCYHINELWYLKYILSRYAPSKNAKPLSITSRRGGWPGNILIAYRAYGNKLIHVKVPQFSLWSIIPILEFTAPIGCLFCVDHLGVNADIVVADAWHPKYFGKDKLGVSLILVRSERGLGVLKGSEEHGYTELVEGSLGDLIIAQKWNSIIRPLQALIRKNVKDRTLVVKSLMLAPRLLIFELMRFSLLLIINSIKSFTYRYAIVRILEKAMYILKLSLLQDKIFKVYIYHPKRVSRILKSFIS